ncbi:MAG TPA: TlpA disulfide reductase family protein [Acidimicrobiales bacterium]|nr:TlpA disulfide reductase family protein [Acidimicrobiales bacterium]
MESVADPPEPAPFEPAAGPSRRRWRVWAAVGVASALLGVLALVLATVGSDTAPSSSTAGGDRAPAFRLPDVRDESGPVSLEEFRGRPVVLNFWASWCVPCRNEMPALQEVSEEVQDRIAFVGVNHQDSRDDAIAFLDETGVRFPAGYDPEGGTATAYGLYGMPTTIFVSPDGRILERHRGEISKAELRREIKRLFTPPP